MTPIALKRTKQSQSESDRTSSEQNCATRFRKEHNESFRVISIHENCLVLRTTFSGAKPITGVEERMMKGAMDALNGEKGCA